MEHAKFALAITVFYFLVVAFERCSRLIAGTFVSERGGQALVMRWIVFHLLRAVAFFVMVLLAASTMYNVLGNQDLSQSFGLTAGHERGKVLYRIPALDLSSGIIILNPHFYLETGPKGNSYILSFKFQIHKGIQDKELRLDGGRFMIESIVGGRVMDQTAFPVSDAFRITDSDVSGTYVSPQPFALKVKPDSIDLTWEMNAQNGDKVSSKPYHIRLQPKWP